MFCWYLNTLLFYTDHGMTFPSDTYFKLAIKTLDEFGQSIQVKEQKVRTIQLYRKCQCKNLYLHFIRRKRMYQLKVGVFLIAITEFLRQFNISLRHCVVLLLLLIEDTS